jgi:hypothetical protein
MAIPLPNDLELDLMTSNEVAILRQWAVAEGWNPGLSDIDVARAYDPEAFIALRRNGELLGGGSIFSYEGVCGFMGLFIMREDQRQRGLGNRLWLHRRDRLRDRLCPNALVGMDGVLHMVPYYSRGGFEYLYEDVRFQGKAVGQASDQCRSMTDQDFIDIAALDKSSFPCDRSAFLRRWLSAPGMKTAVLKDGDKLEAFAALRPAEEGYKFGPVLAYSPEGAREVVAHLMSGVRGELVQLDVPEINKEALALAMSFGLEDVFRCAKMYLGGQPALKTNRVFGLTSFEFG